MVILEDQGETDTIFLVSIGVQVAHLDLELQVGHVELEPEVESVARLTVAKLARVPVCSKLVDA